MGEGVGVRGTREVELYFGDAESGLFHCQGVVVQDRICYEGEERGGDGRRVVVE